MLYLEAPVGVGFSYHNLGDDFANNDNSTAADNYMGLKRFFQGFQQMASHPFYISGESCEQWRAAFPCSCVQLRAMRGNTRHWLRYSWPVCADAGIYVPTLAEQVLWGRDRGDPDIWSTTPLAGILVGNGCNGEDTWSCGSPPAEVSLAAPAPAPFSPSH